MDKTIIIGVGGTGLDTVRCLRRRIVETNGSLDALPNLGFLYLDTDRNAVKLTDDNRKRWEVLGVSVALSEAEYYIIDAPEVGPIVNNISKFPDIRHWFPADQLRSIDQSAKDTPGARQIRPLGRFAFTLKTEEVEGKFKALYNRLPQSSGGGKTQIYLACSLSGGTGSGMFLDLAYRIQEWTNGNCQMFAFLVFPELTTQRGDRYLVNAYASLLELNYFSIGNHFRLPGKKETANSVPAPPPFDYCYIVSPRNGPGVEIALETVPEMIAHKIFLNFDSSFATDARSLLNNGAHERTQKLTDPFTGAQHSQNFFTFGLSCIQYPIEQLTEIFAYQLCAATTGAWLRSREVPGNVAEMLRNHLEEMKLTDDYLLGDKNIFGTSGDFDSYERQIEAFVNELKGTHPAQNIGAAFTEKQAQFLESQFRRVGAEKFYVAKKDDLKGAAETVGRLIRKYVSGILSDPKLGHEFADKALSEMLRIFEMKFKKFTETLDGLKAKESASRRALDNAYKRTAQAESKLVFRNRAIKQNLEMVGDAMRLNLSAAIGLRAYEFGRALLTLVIEDLKAVHSELTDWLNNVERLHDAIEKEIKTRKEHLVQKMCDVKGFNGTILFDEKLASVVYEQFDQNVALPYLEGKILAEREKGLLGALASNSSVMERLYLAAIYWISNVSKVRIADQNVADKILEDYPKLNERRKVLTDNSLKSEPFLVFEEYEKKIARDTPGGYVYNATTSAALVGFLDDATQYPSVNTLLLDITAATGSTKISTISDPHQILMLHEITAFPLRLIQDLKRLKELYGQYIHNSRALPVHIQTRFQPPMGELFLTSDEEIRAFEETEEAFLIAWVEGKIKFETNRREQSDEVRYRYNDAGSDTFKRLGTDFESSLGLCLANSEESQTIRDRLKDEISRYMKTLDTQPKKREFAARLARHLQMLKETIDPELKEESPVYKRYDLIRQRINRRFSLPTENLPLIASAVASGPVPISEDEEAFSQLVQTALKSCEGQLTEAMAKMLQTKQKRYGIPDSRAQEIIRLATADKGESPARIEYREMFQAFLEQGEIDDDQRAQLVSTQVELNLTAEETEEIESRVVESTRQ